MDNASRFTFSGPNSWPLEAGDPARRRAPASRASTSTPTTLPNYPGTFTPERVQADPLACHRARHLPRYP